MSCSCASRASDFGTFTVATSALADELASLHRVLPELQAGKRQLRAAAQADVRIHRFKGTLHGVPLGALELHSIAIAGKAGADERRFIGRLGEASFAYRLAASFVADGILRLKISVEGEGDRKASAFECRLDVRTGLLISTSPDLRDADPGTGPLRSTAQRMLALSGADFLLAVVSLHYLACVIEVVIHAGGLCGWLFLGCGAPPACAAIIPAYVMCAGPAIAAAILCC
jgi:hypothetical protein